MAENEFKNHRNRKRIRQPPSVPFLWEVRPGMPKKDWRPEPPSPIALAPSHSFELIAYAPCVVEATPQTPTSSPWENMIDQPLLLLPPPLLDNHESETAGPSVDGREKPFGSDIEAFEFDLNGPQSIPRVPSRPVKLVASVPFVWEEKPGKPLPYFSPQYTNIVDFLLPLPPPPSWQPVYEEAYSTGSNDHTDGNEDDEREVLYTSEIRSFTFEISEPSYVSRVPSRPMKLMASVPFMWEEKPGIPLPSFSKANYPQSLDDCEPQLDLHKDCNDPIKLQQGMSEWGFASSSSETDEEGSFSSAHSLLANCLMPTSAISTAVPVEVMAPSTNENSPKLASSSSTSLSASDTEMESTMSSYATGASGPIGSAFLEWLFPLFPPKSGLLDKSRSHKRAGTSNAPQEKEGRNFSCQNNANLGLRKPTTLGELIMMSRRRSNRRKAVPMRKQNPSMHELMKSYTFGCGIFGCKLIEALNLKRQLRLKLA